MKLFPVKFSALLLRGAEFTSNLKSMTENSKLSCLNELGSADREARNDS
jgi:hypothetical protein